MVEHSDLETEVESSPRCKGALGATSELLKSTNNVHQRCIAVCLSCTAIPARFIQARVAPAGAGTLCS